MTDRDMRPTRFDLTLQYAREFVTEWFDQNPLGQIGIVGMRGGIGERIGEMSGTVFFVSLSFSSYLSSEPPPPFPYGGGYGLNFIFFVCVCMYRESAGCASRDF
jgi:hypothetical protein